MMMMMMMNNNKEKRVPCVVTGVGVCVSLLSLRKCETEGHRVLQNTLVHSDERARADASDDLYDLQSQEI